MLIITALIDAAAPAGRMRGRGASRLVRFFLLAETAEAAQEHCKDDDETLCDILHIGVDADQVHDIGQDGQQACR